MMTKFLILYLSVFLQQAARQIPDHTVKGITIKENKAIDVEPRFPGGTKAFYHYLSTNVIYSDQTSPKYLQGIVVVTMAIDKEGSVSDVKVVKGISDILDKETVRVLSNSPRWQPGMQRGRPIRVRPTITINYALVNTKEKH